MISGISSGVLRQAFALLVTSQVLICLGVTFGINSVTLIQVPRQPDRFLSDGQLNWTVSVTMLGALLGGLVSAPAAGPLGARRLCLLAMPAHAAGALAAALGGSFVWVLLGRLLMVAALGATEGPARALLAEVVAPGRRALAATALNAALGVGQVAVLLAAPWLRWQTLLLAAGCAPPALCAAGLLLLPDSPSWLLARGRPAEEAHRAITFYRPEADAAAELAAVQSAAAGSEGGPSLCRPEALRPLVRGGVAMALVGWCGGSALVQITPLVLEPLALPLGSYQRALLVPALGLLLVGAALPLVDRYGRLPLLRLGGALSAAGCATVAAYCLLEPARQARLGGLALTGALLVAVAHFCLLGPVLFTYASELLPSGLRERGAIIIVTCLNSGVFLMLKLYPIMRESLGLGGTFVVHTAASLGMALLTAGFLPETRGLSLEQISDLFTARPTDKGSVERPEDSANDHAQTSV
ncbi:solute carrier family 2, facilitated glucose transporter member 6-like [Amphibalanus amphitrite]|uniref:solute carrier family 2, facilitated glucose transporter member 6-like n=1 Tax=Amphibalanus amphitrite TaxID=1232801 RepID=UPI001C91D786|nr:solute carrier family 2, facilitated glucose transporter member 6-like [Amphibalanus amphitrite]